MGLFGKKEEEIKKINAVEKSEEIILKEELEAEVEKLQKEFRAKNEEIKENEQKLNSVKVEYDSSVTNLMEIKKEINQKKMELDVVNRESKETRQKIEGMFEKDQENKRLINELEKNNTNLKNVEQEFEKSIKMDNEIKAKISEGKLFLQELKSQEIQSQKELEEITSRLYNAKQEPRNSDNIGIFTVKEKEFIKNQIGTKQETKGIIEAASVITASLKSKLNMTQKELETVQQLLEKERKEHIATKERLEK